MHDAYPDTYSIHRIGLDRYIEAYRVWPQPRNEEVAAHASAHGLEAPRRRSRCAASLVVVSLNLLDPLLDAMESPQEAPVARARKHFDDAAAQSASRLPGRDHRRVSVFAGALRILPPGYGRRGDALDKPQVQFDLLREAEAKYTESTGEKLAHWQRRMIARYTRNLAHISGDLVASVYDLAVAGALHRRR